MSGSTRPEQENPRPGNLERWERLLEVADLPVWREEDYGPLLAHQLAAPLRLDLLEIDDSAQERLALLREVKTLGIHNLAQLFQHPTPPLELLRLVKDFAKTLRNHAESPLPENVAGVLYFVSVAVARTRWDTRISLMDDQQLRQAIQWILDREWVDRQTKEILLAALSQIPPNTAYCPANNSG